MKLFTGFLTLFLAILISAVAAYFSVAGLVAIFPATAFAIMLMGVVLEIGKVVSAGWLHSNWKNPHVNGLHKTYMIIAISALMVITSLGIYGYLAKGHLEQQTPLAGIELQINQKQAQIDLLTADISSQNVRITQMDSAVNSLIGNDKAERGLRYRYSQRSERKQAQDTINENNEKIQKLTTELVPLKLQINEVETKLGPLKYVAQLFGFTDTDFAVRIVILIIMSAFDPLAIILVISSIITISESQEEKKKEKLDKDTSISLTKDQYNDLLLERDTAYNNIEELRNSNIIKLEELKNYYLQEISNLNDTHSIDTSNFNSEINSLKNEYENIIKNYNIEIDKLIWARDTAQTEADNLKMLRIENIYDIMSNPEFIEQSSELEQDVQPDIADDKELLIEILQRKPELLLTIVDVIREQSNNAIIDVVREQANNTVLPAKSYGNIENVDLTKDNKDTSNPTSWLE